MIPNKGLYLDSNPIDQPAGTWRSARNLLKSKVKGAFTSDEGTQLTGTGYPFATAKPIGTAVFPDGSYVVFSDGINGGEDRIGLVESSTYTDLIVDDILGLDANFPIRSSEIDYNYLGERIVSWTDKNQKPKILNIDNIPVALDGNKALVTPSELVKLNVFPEFDTPSISAQVINTGGAIKSGAYSFSLVYSNDDGTETSYTPPQCSVYINEDTTSDSTKHDGSIPGQLTSKLIRLTLSSVDINYDKVTLIAISTINGIKTAFEVKTVSITGTSMVIDYLGSEKTTDITLEEVLTPRPVYIKTGAMAQLKNVLYHANLETQEDIDFQSIANNIKVFYNSKLVSVTDVNVAQTPGFAHGEVYAFYIVFVLKNGSFSQAFHIPGRPIIGGETPTPTNTFNITISGNTLTGKRYQFYDTTNKNAGTYSTLNGVVRQNNLNGDSNMGYWENENEVYPANFPNLAGQKVRHHVFPTYKVCKDTHYSGDAEYLKSKLDILGVDISNVSIPSDIAEKISGYFIAYAKKDYVNSINYGLDLLQYSGTKRGGTADNIIYDPMFNNVFQWSALQPTDSRGLVLDTQSIRCHNFDLIKDKPQLSANNLFVRLEARYRYYGSRIVGSGDFVSDSRGGFVYTLDYINRPLNNFNSGVVVDFPAATDNTSLIFVSEFKYIPNGIIDGNIYNTKSGECAFIRFPYNYLPPGFTTKNMDFIDPGVRIPTSIIAGGNASNPTNFIEETYLYSLRQLKTNVHSLYNQQELIMTVPFISKGVTSYRNIVGGDKFISPRSMMNLGATSTQTDVNTERGLAIKYHITESKANQRYRYEVSGEEQTKYYPKTAANLFYSDEDSREILFDFGGNPYDTSGYKEDYNTLNDYNQVIIYEPSLVTTHKFPYRVIRSGFAGTNPQGLSSWKTYLTNDFYERNRNRGPIENLAVLDDVLFIHHTYGLFRTIGSEKLSFDTTEVYLGAGDIFSQEPKEPIPSKLGYLGTQNIFGCSRNQ